jgi:alpha-beta hydrolase superfamily lysophospholipase
MTAFEWNNPPALAPRGTVIIVPGRGEHGGLYERFGTRLAFDAYRVRAVSDPTRDDRAPDQIADLAGDVDLPGPKVLVGSDTGALFAVAAVATGQVKVDALILAGLPTRDRQASPLAIDWDTELSERTACSTHQGKLRSDGAVEHGALNTPPPAAWFTAADLAAVAVPILGLHGSADTISPIDAVRSQYARAGRASLVSIEGGKHDALNDANHRVTAATIVLFLERLRLGADLPTIARTELEPAS